MGSALVLIAIPGPAVSAVGDVDVHRNKALVARFVDVVWRQGRLEDLGRFWTATCVNHADPAPANVGLAALRLYHQTFAQAFTGFASVTIEIVQQIAEGDRVVTQMLTKATRRADGKPVSLATIRIDRLENGKIAEHWSVADMAGLAQQLQS